MLQCENRLERFWNEMQQNHTIPEELRKETEQGWAINKLQLRSSFNDHYEPQDVIQNRLREFHHMIGLVTPVFKEASPLLGNNAKIFVVDSNGVVIYSQPDDVIGFHCKMGETFDHQQLDHIAEQGKSIEINYDNGKHTIVIPVVNQSQELLFGCGISDIEALTFEMYSVLYLAVQLIQQRYMYNSMIDEYTTAFIDTITENMFLLNEQGRIINVNQTCMELFNISNREILKGMHIKNLIVNDGSFDIFRTNHFNLQLCDNEIHCRIKNKNLINTPYGKQLVLSFDKLDDHLCQAEKITDSNIPHVTFDSIVGYNKAINDIKTTAKQAAITSATVLLEGESGTGKELFAHAIHHESRRQGVFVAVNCGAIPAALIQSELFGYEEGAFTGAKKRGSIGIFEIADGGTVFLDEIGEMPFDMQVNLLRFLQDRVITRVGSHVSKKVDVRIIAATNRNLKKEVEKGNFREDLYYRINVINIDIPPLRERKEDIPILADYFLEKQCKLYDQPIQKLRPVEKNLLMNYHWSGNARELENIIERAYILRKGEALNFDSLPDCSSISTNEQPTYIEAMGDELSDMGSFKEAGPQTEVGSPLNRAEKETIEKYLRICRGNVSETASILGITRPTLYRKMKILNIDHTKIDYNYYVQ